MQAFHQILTVAASIRPEKEALVCGDRRASYRELDQLSNGLAELLLARGIGRGDRVGILATKDIEEVAAIFAISKVGAVMVHMNPGFRSQQVAHAIHDCSMKAVLVNSDRAQVLAATLSTECSLDLVVSLSSPIPNVLVEMGTRARIEGLSPPQAVPPESCPDRDVEDLAAIIYTSGSTGMPKGIMVSHRVFLEATRTCATLLGNDQADRLISVTPFSFDGALSQLFTAFVAGGTLVLQRSTFPNDIVRTLLRERVTGFHAMPSLWNMLLNSRTFGNNRYPDLRYITIIGEAFQPRRLAELRRVLASTKFYMMYGTTEAFRSTCLPLDEACKRPTSVGRPLPGVVIDIVDGGRKCAPGVVGEIVHRGAFVASGYWRNPEKTAEVFRDGGVYTGDLGRLDEDGYLYFVGRNDSMIKTNGFRVSPDEIERSLCQLVGLREAAVVPVPDPTIGYAIRAFVVRDPGATLDEKAVVTHCRRQLPHYMVPTRVEFLGELPKTPTGKLARSSLLEQRSASRTSS